MVADVSFAKLPSGQSISLMISHHSFRWCRQAPSQWLNHSWSRSMPPYGVASAALIFIANTRDWTHKRHSIARPLSALRRILAFWLMLPVLNTTLHKAYLISSVIYGSFIVSILEKMTGLYLKNKYHIFKANYIWKYSCKHLVRWGCRCLWNKPRAFDHQKPQDMIKEYLTSRNACICIFLTAPQMKPYKHAP